MLLCNTEIIKKRKELESEKKELISFEQRNKSVSYSNESEKILSEYNFAETRRKIDEINKEVRKLRHLLSVSNTTTIVKEFDMTIGECIVYAAQLNQEKDILEYMVRENQVTRSTSYSGVAEFTQLMYTVSECKVKLVEISNTITKLQLAIDRTNLTNMVEV